MTRLSEHPTVRAFTETALSSSSASPASLAALDAEDLRRLCLEAGADDVGFVSLDRPELAEERDPILTAAPYARALISFVCRLNREPIRSPARSVSNLEFHHVGDKTNDVARRVVTALEARGVRALNPSMGFPMEMQNFPDRIWVVGHKTVAVAAGLGQMGIHRNLIHPKFGNFVLLGTIIVDREIGRDDTPIDYNPCLECKLCVAACPVGAVHPDGEFQFAACYNHNYREFMGGFTEWVEDVADSSSAREYRAKVTDSESVSMWESLSFGANYKSAYCMAVCPAGEDVIAPYLANRKQFQAQTLKPLVDKEEAVYVVPGSDAEAHVQKRFPRKTLRHIRKSLRPRSIDGFLRGLELTFQRGPAKGLDNTYHFTFTGPSATIGATANGDDAEPRLVTVVLRDGTLSVEDGHRGDAQLRVHADGKTWLSFLRGDRSLLRALLTRKIRLRGSPKRLLEFARCF